MKKRLVFLISFIVALVLSATRLDAQQEYTQVSDLAELLDTKVEDSAYALGEDYILTVTFKDGNFTYLQNMASNKAICVYSAHETINKNLSEGISIKGAKVVYKNIEGNYRQFATGLMFELVEFSKVDKNEAVVPLAISLNDMEEEEELASLENTLVRLKKISFTDGGRLSSSSPCGITDGTNRALFANGFELADLDMWQVPEPKQMFNLTGILVKINGVYAIAPRRMSDMQEVKLNINTNFTDQQALIMPELYAYKIKVGASIINDEEDKISDFKIYINGEEIVDTNYEKGGNYREIKYTPKSFGEKIELRAEVSTVEGKSEALVVSNVEVQKADLSKKTPLTVRSMDKLLINFPNPGRTNGGVYYLPQHIGTFNSIKGYLSITCPMLPGTKVKDCDDWDRVAWIEIQTPDGEWHEIIRYITSYGKACDHSIDLTAFAPYLQGKVPMRMFVDTWGTGGWEATLDIEYTYGKPQYLYTELFPLWNAQYPFGDWNNLQPCDTIDYEVPATVEAASIKLVTTGHNWGNLNSGNAAEFYAAVHHVKVNGTSYEQSLEQICSPNPDGCQPQNGTWQYERAGWCPGAISKGFNYNITDKLKEKNLKLCYIFEEGYRDYCHPNNPDCVDGRTCSNCNDPSNPIYYVASYLVQYSNAPLLLNNEEGASKYTKDRDVKIRVSPNPTKSVFRVNVEEELGAGTIKLMDMLGRVHLYKDFKSTADLNSLEFNIESLRSGSYVLLLRASNWYSGCSTIVKE